MAAWIVVGVMAGVMAGMVAGWKLSNHLTEPITVEVPAVVGGDGDQAILNRVLDRLLEAVVPEVREEPRADAPTTTHEAEYEAPDVEVGDWTDPFIGIERPMVARLAPGQAIPGMEPVDGEHVDAVQMWQDKGEGAFDEWARETMAPGAWVEPMGEV